MFNNSMKQLNLDTKKMPLGKLSKQQISKGFDTLDELEDAIKTNANNTRLAELSSRFYTLIPHDFGRRVPPVMKTEDEIREKKDMLLVLSDIELAQSIQKQKASEVSAATLQHAESQEELPPHPLDEKFQLLKTSISPLAKDCEEFKWIEKYIKETGNRAKLDEVFKIDREKEGERFASHKNLTHRKLLWHGTNLAVVVAILKDGLRIMPHSGGRVGRAIYFASENSKSAGYTSGTWSTGMQMGEMTGIMFLAEVALGNEYSITKDDHTLKKPPTGYDSVVARGHTEPDDAGALSVTLEGNKVVIPAAKPRKRPEFSNSYFHQSEYCVYKESQARLRYLLKVKL
ncbi:unnamed protein product [Cyprideis torosa]|uniref:Uncharacterized protein n=1 Tax=Cyprideis torosa TaxID=163714 RepID=A0A7R8WBK3_9CRUS|nr:unnamed protein product [Cyprideis torosa]CAG0887462.1 unnamed protein product [Cyprideis torosa]